MYVLLCVELRASLHFAELQTCIKFLSRTQVGYYNGSVPGRAVGIADAYGLDSPGIESRWGRDFLHLSRPALRPTQPRV